MRFGPVPVDQAAGAVLAHSLGAPTGFRKGRVLSADDVAALRAAGYDSVVAAQLDPGDVGEDEAASRIAARLAAPGLKVAAPFTGRVNLFAEQAGLLLVDEGAVDRLNLVDEAVTLATIANETPVEPRQMVATIKIIPFAVSGEALERAEAALNGPILTLAPYRPHRAVLIQTRLPALKDSVVAKTVGVTRERLAALSMDLVADLTCPHEPAAVAASVEAALEHAPDVVLIAGASAITDRRDVLPDGIERAGGTVEHFGMPVDPGNLMLLARHGERRILGLPGCARSPKPNGADRVLQRLAAGLPMDAREIMRMGAGGLLAEIANRPQPRAGGRSHEAAAPHAPRIAALVLAAGRSQRMGTNKLLAPVAGKPMVAHVVDAALASEARPVIVVVGHQRDDVAAALGDRPVRLVDNPHFADGMASSLKAGLAALPDDADGVVVCLGDMPRVGPGVIDRLIAAYNPTEGRLICVPTRGGKRGNPVLWDRSFFAEMRQLDGDIGARNLIGAHDDALVEVAMPDDAVLVDIDTPEALATIV